MTSPADRIIDLYARHGATWAAARGTILHERQWIDRFAALLAPGADVLDIGCGSGEPIARHLAGLGHAITGIDSSPALVALFNANLPGHAAVVADMRTLDLGRTFGGLVAWDSFFHLAHADQRAMFPVFAAHAAAGAPLIVTTGPAHGEAIGTLEGEPLYHASLAPDEYRGLFASAGFDVVAFVPQDATCGGHTVWLARRR